MQKVETQLFNLEQLTQTIEFALVEQQFLKGLELGNQVLKEIHKETSLENVEKLMSDTADAIEYQAEIEQTISNNLSQEEQDAIMNELDALIELEVILLRFVHRFKNAEKFPQVPENGIVVDKAEETKNEIAFPSIPNVQLERNKEKISKEEPLLA